MNAELSQRVGWIIGTHDVTFDERDQVAAAVVHAENWDDLPAGIRSLLLEIERRPGPGGR